MNSRYGLERRLAGTGLDIGAVIGEAVKKAWAAAGGANTSRSSQRRTRNSSITSQGHLVHLPSTGSDCEAR